MAGHGHNKSKTQHEIWNYNRGAGSEWNRKSSENKFRRICSVFGSKWNQTPELTTVHITPTLVTTSSKRDNSYTARWVVNYALEHQTVTHQKQHYFQPNDTWLQPNLSKHSTACAYWSVKQTQLQVLALNNYINLDALLKQKHVKIIKYPAHEIKTVLKSSLSK